MHPINIVSCMATLGFIRLYERLDELDRNQQIKVSLVEKKPNMPHPTLE